MKQSKKQIGRICPICNSLTYKNKYDIYNCKKCDFYFSEFTPGIGAEISGVEYVRTKNFHLILNSLSELLPEKKSIGILDVGCSDGLFLDVVSEYEIFRATGIEPEKDKYDVAIKKGREVFNCLFSADSVTKIVEEKGKFDVVIFNDSFEHIPDVAKTIEAASDTLNNNGIIAFNMPDSKGTIFGISSLLLKMNISFISDRLWQKGYSSPHLYYFNSENMEKLCSKHNLKLILSKNPDSFSISGLWKRLRSKYSFGCSLFCYFILILFFPFFKKSGNIMFLAFKKIN